MIGPSRLRQRPWEALYGTSDLLGCNLRKDGWRCWGHAWLEVVVALTQWCGLWVFAQEAGPSDMVIWVDAARLESTCGFAQGPFAG